MKRLKLRYRHHGGCRPLTGVWIETSPTLHHGAAILVAPSRGCGLKLAAFAANYHAKPVAPSRGCGLKLREGEQS